MTVDPARPAPVGHNPKPKQSGHLTLSLSHSQSDCECDNDIDHMAPGPYPAGRPGIPFGDASGMDTAKKETGSEHRVCIFENSTYIYNIVFFRRRILQFCKLPLDFHDRTNYRKYLL